MTISSTAGIQSKQLLAKRETKFARSKQPGKTFQSYLNELQAEPRAGQLLSSLKGTLAKGQRLQPAELLLYQIKAGEYRLRVEIAAKAADAVLGTVRRFQNNQ